VLEHLPSKYKALRVQTLVPSKKKKKKSQQISFIPTIILVTAAYYCSISKCNEVPGMGGGGIKNDELNYDIVEELCKCHIVLQYNNY
jgi:hypothetical protein